jgi:Alginate export
MQWGWLGLLILVSAHAAVAQSAATVSDGSDAPQRPVIQDQRWEENWSVLADPALQTEPLDALKYIPLSQDGQVWLSFGANARLRMESFSNPNYGVNGQKSNTYLLSRTEVHADLRIHGWQVFLQLQDDRAPGKLQITPADADPLDLEQAFVAHVGEVGDGTLKVRVGRQEMAWDQQRFVSNRDGANVRQAYDAVWADYEIGKWRFISFVSEPVQYRDTGVFDDYSDSSLQLDGFRVERRDVGPGNLAVYYLRYKRDNANFLGASGTERRNAFDMHYAGEYGPVVFDIEGMVQQGSIGNRPVLAWAFGEQSGYRFHAPWSPQLVLQIDAASGNSSDHGTFGTFNPLFLNASYFSLSNLTTYANLIHVKPILSLVPAKGWLLQAAVGFQWRETTHDAVYTVPVQPVANTAGHGNLWTGAYLQLDVSKQINANLSVSAQFVQFQAGETIRAAGGHNVSYGEVQVSLAW